MLIALLLIAITTLPSQALFKFKNEYSHKKHIKTSGLNIFYINKAKLYLAELVKSEQQESSNWLSPQLMAKTLDHNQDFKNFSEKKITKLKQPDIESKSEILFEHSELLLQESIREILYSISKKAVDLVIFGGDQIYSENHRTKFLDIVKDLSKFSVPYYEVQDPEQPFYLLKARGINIIVLDNQKQDISPADLPAGATLQYLWLKDLLERIKHSGEQAIVFSYRTLSPEDKLLFQGIKTIELFIDSKTSSVQLSSYPLSYLQIFQDSQGVFKTKIHKIGLEQMQKLARERALQTRH